MWAQVDDTGEEVVKDGVVHASYRTPVDFDAIVHTWDDRLSGQTARFDKIWFELVLFMKPKDIITSLLQDGTSGAIRQLKMLVADAEQAVGRSFVSGGGITADQLGLTKSVVAKVISHLEGVEAAFRQAIVVAEDSFTIRIVEKTGEIIEKTFTNDSTAAEIFVYVFRLAMNTENVIGDPFLHTVATSVPFR